MELLPAEIATALPNLYSTEHDGDPVCRVKFFTPDSSWTWYGTEYDPEQRLFFGYVVGLSPELGYFSLDDLEAARGPLGLPVERDLWFYPVEAVGGAKGGGGQRRMTTLVLTPCGDMWASDGLTRPRSPAALEHEAECLRRRPRPSVEDLLHLGALEEEIIGRYLTLTEQCLTQRDKAALDLSGPPSQDELAWVIAGLDECEFLGYLRHFPEDAVIGKEGDPRDCVIHRYLVGRFGARPDAVVVRLDVVLLQGDWVELDRIIPLPPWASRISRLTTHRQGVFQPVRNQRIRARWLRRALSPPAGGQFRHCSSCAAYHIRISRRRKETMTMNAQTIAQYDAAARLYADAPSAETLLNLNRHALPLLNAAQGPIWKTVDAPDAFAESFSRIRVVCDRRLDEGEVELLAGCLGYALRATLAGDDLGDPETTLALIEGGAAFTIVEMNYDSDSSHPHGPRPRAGVHRRTVVHPGRDPVAPHRSGGVWDEGNPFGGGHRAVQSDLLRAVTEGPALPTLRGPCRTAAWVPSVSLRGREVGAGLSRPPSGPIRGGKIGVSSRARAEIFSGEIVHSSRPGDTLSVARPSKPIFRPVPKVESGGFCGVVSAAMRSGRVLTRSVLRAGLHGDQSCERVFPASGQSDRQPPEARE